MIFYLGVTLQVIGFAVLWANRHRFGYCSSGHLRNSLRVSTMNYGEHKHIGLNSEQMEGLDCGRVWDANDDHPPRCGYSPGDVVPVRTEDIGIPRVEVFIFGLALGIFIGAIISALVL